MNYDIIELYRESQPMEVNNSLVAYGVSVVNSGGIPNMTSKQIWVRMYKFAVTQSHPKRNDIREVLVRLFGEETIDYIDNVVALGGAKVGNN